jgi:hypothetical protein
VAPVKRRLCCGGGMRLTCDLLCGDSTRSWVTGWVDADGSCHCDTAVLTLLGRTVCTTVCTCRAVVIVCSTPHHAVHVATMLQLLSVLFLGAGSEWHGHRVMGCLACRPLHLCVDFSASWSSSVSPQCRLVTPFSSVPHAMTPSEWPCSDRSRKPAGLGPIGHRSVMSCS